MQNADRFLGFLVHLSLHSIPGQRDVDLFLGFVVSWFSALHLWTGDAKRFLGFMVSCTPFLDSEIFGFMVS